MSNNSGITVLALITGAAIGAGIGILFAPDKGSATRQKIKSGFDDAKLDLQGKIEEAAEKIKERVLRKKFDLEDSYDHLVSNVEGKKEDLVGFLENKLNELKKARSTGSNFNASASANAKI